MLNNPIAYYNVAKISPFTDRIVNGGRFMDILIGDSTTAFGSHGHDGGAQQAYLFFGIQPFGTGFNGVGEGYGLGSGIGHFHSNFGFAFFNAARHQIVFSDVTAGRNGEKFRFTRDGSTSADITFSNVAATMRVSIRDALATLTGLNANRIFVDSRSSGGGADSNTTYQVYYVGDQFGKEGGSLSDKQSLVFTDLTSARNGETFKLTMSGNNSADIAFNSTATTMRTNLKNGVESITGGPGSGNVTVTGSGSAGDPYIVEVTGSTVRGLDYATMTRTAPGAGTPYAGTITIANVRDGSGMLVRTTPSSGVNYAGTVTVSTIAVGTGDLSAVPASWWPYLEPARKSTKWRVAIVRGVPTSGSFTLQINGMTNVSGQSFGENAVIPYNATSADVQAIIDALSMFAPGDVAVTGPAGGPWDIDFLSTGAWNWDSVAEPLLINNTLNNGAVPYFEETSSYINTLHPRWRVSSIASAPTNGHYIVGDASTGIGSAPGYVTRDTEFHTWYLKGPGTLGGSSPSNVRGQWSGNSESHRIQLHNAASGTFTLTFGGQTTTALQYDDSAANVQSALQALSSIGAGNCTVAKIGTISSAWAVTFAGTMASTNVSGNFTANLTGITAFNTEIPKSFETSVYEGRGTSVFFPIVGGSDHTLTSDDAAVSSPYVARDTFALAADSTRSYDLIAMPERIGVAITPPMGWLFQASDSPSRTSGFMVWPLVYRGGRGLRTYGQVLKNTSTPFMLEVFKAARFMFTKVGQTPCIRVRIFGGVNDQNDTKPCNGTGAYDSNTQLGFLENLRRIRTFFETFWTAQGWPVSELHYECNVSAVTTNGDANLAPFRTAAKDWSDQNDRCCACDWSQLIYSFAQAQARFGPGADSAHPSILGFYDYHRVALGSLLAARLASIPSSGGSTVVALDSTFSRSVVAVPTKVFKVSLVQDTVATVECNIPELHGPNWFVLPVTLNPIDFTHVNGISRVNLRSPSGVATNVTVTMSAGR